MLIQQIKNQNENFFNKNRRSFPNRNSELLESLLSNRIFILRFIFFFFEILTRQNNLEVMMEENAHAGLNFFFLYQSFPFMD